MSTALLSPAVDEYAPYYGRYISRVPQGDLFAVLAAQPAQLRQMLGGLDAAGAGFRFGPDEWSVKEVLGHLCDWERILAFRALCFARGDQGPLPGLEPDGYVREAHFDERALADLLDEFAALRHASVLVFRALAPEHTLRRGVASGSPMSVRALLFLIAGHVIWHIESLETDYLARMG